MTTSVTRLELKINVFEQTAQQALILPGLTSSELIEAILNEFAPDFNYFSDNKDDYQLVKSADQHPLPDDQKLSDVLKPGETITLIERSLALPAGSSRPRQAIYLREESSQHLYKLHWLPAVIGRRDTSTAVNPLLAVDLGNYTNGLRISRRHAQIVEDQGGQYVLESLAHNNPTVVVRPNERPVVIDGQRYQILHGDTIRFQNSELKFQFIIRNGQ